MYMFWIALIGVIAFIYWNNGKKRSAAEEAYQESLRQLKKDPRNADLRQQTLGLGRHYSSFLRSGTGHALFDEVALMNDINAACAGSTTQDLKPEMPHADTVELRLEMLMSLKNRKLIDEAEYAQRRREILSSI
jgi:hypothetical protein